MRNFYNNIIAPKSPSGDITADTHAVAAAHLMPYGASALPVEHNFGTKGSSSPVNGVKGNYHLYADAYRQAAKEVGLLPRQMQSITWEAIRAVYSSSDRTNKVVIARSREIWQNHSDAKARKELLKAGVPAPAWSRSRNDREPQSQPEVSRKTGEGEVALANLRYGSGGPLTGAELRVAYKDPKGRGEAGFLAALWGSTRAREMGGESPGSFSFSPAAGERLESAIVAKLNRGPEERIDYASRLIDRLAGLREKTLALGSLSEEERLRENIREAQTIFTALPPEARGHAIFPLARILDAKTERGRITILEEMITNADRALPEDPIPRSSRPTL